MLSINLNALDDMNSLLWANNGSGSQGFAYSPFGSTAARSSGDSLLPGFNGERLDPVSQRYNLGNGYRTYNPTLMRFNAPDSWSPFGAGGLNQYVYCDGDPINRSDPSGHMSVEAGASIGLMIFDTLLDVVTMGMAIPATEAARAVFSVWDAVELVGTALDAASDVTSIACTATQESDPEASQILSWCSLALFMASFTTNTANSIHEKFSGRSASYDLSNDGSHRKGGGADSSIGKPSSHSDRHTSDEQSHVGGDQAHSASVHSEPAGVGGRAPYAENTHDPSHYSDRTVSKDHASGSIVPKGAMPDDVMHTGRYHRNFDLVSYPDVALGVMWGVYFATSIAGGITMNSNPKAPWILQQFSGALFVGLYGTEQVGSLYSTISHSRKMARWKKVR